MKKLITISVITASSLLAVTPNIDSTLQSIQLPKEVETMGQNKKEPLVEIGGKSKYAPVMRNDKSGKKVFVKNFSIEGNSHINSNELTALILDLEYVNKNLSFDDLTQVASVITKHHRNKGFFVARAYIPVQDLYANDGKVKITVIKGSYGDFKLTNISLVKDEIVQGMLDDVKNRDNVVSTHTLERVMLIINDTPGVKITSADIMPGVKVGTSDFKISSDKRAVYDGYVIADNYGSLYSGKNRIMAGANLNSPTGLGDKLSISGLISNGANLKNGKVSYGLSLMSNGLRGEISYSKTNYDFVRLGSGMEDGANNGTTSTIEVSATYPIVRTRLETLNMSASITKKDAQDFINFDQLSKDRDLKATTLRLNHSKKQTLFGFDAKVTTKGSLTFGKLDIVDETSKTTDLAGANTQGDYSKLNLNLGANLLFNPTFSLSTSLKTQYAFNNKNLDGSEDMSIGGSNGVKVYPDGELSGENGYVMNLELFSELPQAEGFSHKLGFFYDIGSANMSDSSKDTTFKRKTLQDIGIGYYVDYQNMFAKIQLARIVGGDDITTENKGDVSRILFQAGLVF
jgi:hemolysin activation/secretion protein